MPHNAGGSWIWHTTRLAIYLRDRWSCVWCGKHAHADQILISLDHLLIIRPKADHSPANLVTACWSCNSRRKDRALYQWLRMLPDPDAARRSYRNAVRRKLPRKEARQLHKKPTRELVWLRNRTKMSFGEDHFLSLEEAAYYRQKEAEEALDAELDRQDRLISGGILLSAGAV